jgi:LPXTG-motif cell wall-anchored protein
MKVKKKALSLILAVAMVLGAVPFTSVVANAEDTGVKKIELKTSGVADKDFVYFGNYSSTDIKWKVLDADADNTGTANGMFLLSEYLLEQNNKPFEAAWNSDDGDGQTNPNEWQHSDAQDWCTTFADSSAFTGFEKTAMKSVSKTDAAINKYDIDWATSSLDNEKVFYLSAEEAANYIGPKDRDEGLATTTSGNAAGGWWLRSPFDYDTYLAGYVYEDGLVHYIDVIIPYPGVRPAFNLNLNSVLFSSAAVGGKSSGTVGAAALNSVSEYTSDTAKEWKVTLLDTARTFTAQAANGATTTKDAGYSNWSVDITYSNAKTDTNEYVSAMICDENDNVLYYGNIAQNSASGTQTVNIPTGLAVGNYTLKVFSEQLNGDKKTDYASAFKDIALEVTPPKAADYTDVDKAISEIPADLSVYTNASVNVLNDAVAAVDRNKTQAEQATVNGYATAIRDAIKALKYKDADYSKVDTAIGKIPADLSGYTDASVKALNDAKKAVVRGKNITEQATVDGYATAIQKAIDGLVKKTGTTGNNNNNNNNDSNKDKNVTSPQTGDSSNMFLWLAILMISAGGIVTIGITQKTRKKHSER